MRLIVIVGALAAFAGLSACGGDEEVVRSPSPTPSMSTTPGEIAVSWSEAKQMLRDCKVKAVMQAHSLEVWLTMEDESRVTTVEPAIDDVLNLAFDAQRKCGGQPEQIATE
jgi:hypothetical protein